MAWLYPSQEDQKGMLSVEDWAEIRRLYRAKGLPKKAIARVLGISKNTVKARRWLVISRRSMNGYNVVRLLMRLSRASVSCWGLIRGCPRR